MSGITLRKLKSKTKLEKVDYKLAMLSLFSLDDQNT